MQPVGQAVSALAASFAQRAVAPEPRYDVIFNTVSDRASEPGVAPAAPKAWGGFRLAAWAWAGDGDVGPVVIAAAQHAYGQAAAMAPISFRNITTI